MITITQTGKPGLRSLPLHRLCMKTLLQCYLNCTRPIRCKKTWPNWWLVLAAKRSASLTAGSCVQPPNITCESRFACSMIAAVMRWFVCPKILTHHELMASKYRRPDSSISHPSWPERIASGGHDCNRSIWLQGCQIALKLLSDNEGEKLLKGNSRQSYVLLN